MGISGPDPAKSYEVLVPGKTFLVGEYLALAGGPSVVANTQPCFRFRWTLHAGSASARKADEASQIEHGFHPESPAGKFLNRLNGSQLLGNQRAVIEFHDPHFGKGGLGASTAEFLGAWVFEKWATEFGRADIRDHRELVETLANHLGEVAPLWKSERVGSARFRDLLDSYRLVVETGSGADLVSQAAGGIAVWDGVVDQMRKFTWPFQELSMTLLKTGRKLQTHRYLAESVQGKGVPSALSTGTGLKPLEPDFVQDMREWVSEAVQGLAFSDADRFIAAVRGTGKALENTGRVAAHTASILDELSEESEIRAAKGCGAMGSDVILVLHDGSEKASSLLLDLQKRHGLELAATESDLHLASLQLSSAHVSETGMTV